jgi:hypothetical protein
MNQKSLGNLNSCSPPAKSRNSARDYPAIAESRKSSGQNPDTVKKENAWQADNLTGLEWSEGQ